MRTPTVTDRLENVESLDAAVTKLRALVGRVPQGRVKNALHGVALGHPVHPMLAQSALGAFFSAGVLDVTGRHDGAARLLMATGLVASAPAALSGAVDWADQHEQQMRVGIVHAAANTFALGCYAASLLVRGRGWTASGRALGMFGLLAVSGSAYLGGHMAFQLSAPITRKVFRTWCRRAGIGSAP